MTKRRSHDARSSSHRKKNHRNAARRRERQREEFTLQLEGLEPRHMMTAIPWHNNTLPLDVDQNGKVEAADLTTFDAARHGSLGAVVAVGDPPDGALVNVN